MTDKLTQVHERIFCCRSGSAADTQAVADIVQHQLALYSTMHSQNPTVKTAATLFQKIIYANKDALMAGIIIGGVDHTGPSVYSIPLGGSLHKRPFAIGGSGSTYIYGYCDAHWKDNMTRDEAIDFCRNAITLALSRDGSSGGTVRLAVVTADNVERIFTPGNELPVFWEG